MRKLPEEFYRFIKEYEDGPAWTAHPEDIRRIQDLADEITLILDHYQDSR